MREEVEAKQGWRQRGETGVGRQVIIDLSLLIARWHGAYARLWLARRFINLLLFFEQTCVLVPISAIDLYQRRV
jgi:hypothetical protein